jgi:predicted RND superfamily exporter protein
VFWAPMALAMMGGLIAATILTLTFLPALYALAFKVTAPMRADARSIDEKHQEPSEERVLQTAA